LESSCATRPLSQDHVGFDAAVGVGEPQFVHRQQDRLAHIGVGAPLDLEAAA
jgi:hypothetical protein